MKIEIITRHAIANYGSVLQSYATEKIFQKMGYDTEIVNYIPEAEVKKNQCETFANFSKIFGKNKITKFIYKILQKRNIYKMYDMFSKYRKKILNISNQEFNSIDELKRNYPKADIYCTGSDQVWGNIGNNEYDEAYFLSFLPRNTKCIAFSASFGKEKISPYLYNKLPKLLDKYDLLLLREISGINILKKLGNYNTKLFLDPTLLLQKEEWENLCQKKLLNKEYILVYQLHHNRNFDKYIKKIAKQKKIDVIRISVSKYYKFKYGRFIYLPSIEEFLGYIKNAKYIITDSFHCTVFSLIFNIPFLDILPNNTGTRIESLLEMTNLKDRIVMDYDDINIINKKINFGQVNSIIDKKRNDDLQFLQKQMKIFNKYK